MNHFKNNSSDCSIAVSQIDLSRLYELCQSCRNIQPNDAFQIKAQALLTDFQKLIPSDNLIMLTYNQETDALFPEIILQLPDNLIPGIHERITNTSLVDPILTKEPTSINLPVSTLFGVSENHHKNLGTTLSLPLIYNQHCLGLLIFDRTDASFTNNETQAAMLFANHFASAFFQSHHDYSEEVVFRRYQDLFERIHVPLFYCTVDGFLKCANQAFYELLGYDGQADSQDQNIFDRIHFSKNDKNTFHDLMHSCGYFKNLEVQIDTDNNKRITALISIIPFYSDGKNIKGYEGVIQDITETLELEEQLIQAQKLGALGSLTGGIAHDFNNLIGGIIGCTSMIMTDMKQTDPFYTDVRTIMNASQKAADLTSQLLAFIRKESYILKPVKTEIMLNDIINLLSRTLPKNIIIKTEIMPDLHCINANTSRFEQAIINLCINARDAMPDGGTLQMNAFNVHLKKRNSLHGKSDHVMIQIRDTGCGIDENIQNKIFDPFFTTKTVHHGSGLGLSIVKDIIENHHGEIMIKSHKDSGTTVDILIPATRESVQDETIKEESRSFQGTETILLVDDEEVIRRMSKRMLERFGYKILIAENGVEALEIYKKEQADIDLVILDMIMPRLDGRKTLKELKQLNPSVKALLFSGHMSKEELNTALNEGFLGLIPKPFETTELLKTVRKVLV